MVTGIYDSIWDTSQQDVPINTPYQLSFSQSVCGLQKGRSKFVFRNEIFKCFGSWEGAKTTPRGTALWEWRLTVHFGIYLFTDIALWWPQWKEGVSDFDPPVTPAAHCPAAHCTKESKLALYTIQFWFMKKGLNLKFSHVRNYKNKTT